MTLGVEVVEERLANGLRVCVVEDHTVPIVAVNLWYGVGSRDEAPGRTGFAHLFEHLMFQGSAKVAAGEHMALLTAVGGEMNASTSFDRTNYYETVPSGALELAVWLEADRMGGLLASLSQETLDNEREVVKNERRQRYDNQPYGTAWEHLFAMLFPDGHPYHHVPIGSMQDLSAASLDDVRRFFTKHYYPGNAVLTMVGDVDPETGVQLAKRHFGPIPARPAAPAARDGQVGALAEMVRRELREPVPAEAYHALYRAPVDGGEDIDALAVACTVLNRSGSGRLFERLVRDKQVAQQVSASVNRLIGGVSTVAVSGTACSGATVAEVESAILEEIETLAADGPTEEELEIAKARRERALLDSTATCASLADVVSQQALQFGAGDRVNALSERIEAVTAERVREAVATWLSPDNRAVLTYQVESARWAA